MKITKIIERRQNKMNKISKTLATTLLTGLGIMAIHTTEAQASEYKVQSGDTLYKIATANNMTLEQLAQSNPQIKNVNLIYVNDTVHIGDSNTATTQQPQQKTQTSYQNTSADTYLLAQLIQAEAGGESYAGKVAVGQVVMNRVYSSQFPDTVQGVIYQSGQFSPVATGSINNQPSSASLSASREAMNSGNTGILYFYNPSTASTNLSNGHAVVKQIGNHVFLR